MFYKMYIKNLIDSAVPVPVRSPSPSQGWRKEYKLDLSICFVSCRITLKETNFCNNDKVRLVLPRSRHKGSPTPWSWVLVQKRVITQLLKKLPTFYGTEKFITMFTTDLFWSLSWVRWI
jgi:hypothetical protein